MQSGMVFCRGCGGKIHSTAVSCPQCGAPQVEASGVAQPGGRVDNGVVWILAFAPLIGYLLEYIVAYAVHDNEWQAELAMQASSYWFVTLLLNIGLSLLDEKRLERSGCDTSKFKGMVWLVPVYLYQRAQTLRHSLSYFIVWVICFILVLFS